jgi:hypothetical protein
MATYTDDLAELVERLNCRFDGSTSTVFNVLARAPEFALCQILYIGPISSG